MAEYRYKIKNKLSHFYSRGGILPKWTTNETKAKLWSQKGDVKSHIAQCWRRIEDLKRLGNAIPPEHLPTNWVVQEFRLEIHNILEAEKFV